MANITNTDPVVTEAKLTEFYNDIKPFLGCPAYVTQEGDAEYYSTDEKVIGRWLDNKPMYQRAFTFTMPSAKQAKALEISDAVIVEVVCGWIVWNDNEKLPITWYSSGDYCIHYKVMNKNQLYIDNAGYGGKTATAIIRYTKNSDSTVTTIEQKPTHYSTDEQVVGTWIDSKPIYQKTLVLSASEWVKYNKKYTIALSSKIPNIKEVVEFNGFVKVSYASQVLTYGFGTTDTSSTGELSIITNCSQGNLCLTDLLGITMVDGSIVTLRYTKTTD